MPSISGTSQSLDFLSSKGLIKQADNGYVLVRRRLPPKWFKTLEEAKREAEAQ